MKNYFNQEKGVYMYLFLYNYIFACFGFFLGN